MHSAKTGNRTYSYHDSPPRVRAILPASAALARLVAKISASTGTGKAKKAAADIPLERDGGS